MVMRHAVCMKRTMIMLPDDVDARLRHEARRRGVSVAQVARDAIERELPSQPDGRRASLRLGRVRRGMPRNGSTSLSLRVCAAAAAGAVSSAARRCRAAVRGGPHAEVAFARSLANGELVAEPVLDSDWERVAELMDQGPNT